MVLDSVLEEMCSRRPLGKAGQRRPTAWALSTDEVGLKGCSPPDELQALEQATKPPWPHHSYVSSGENHATQLI